MAIIRLSKNNTHRCLRGHPWVYTSEFVRVDGPVKDGDELWVHDTDDHLVGRGYYSAKSKIAVRLMTRRDDALDTSFLRKRLQAAIAHRAAILPGRPCHRLVSSEGDLLPGLIVDRYHDMLAVQCTTAGMDRRLPVITDLLKELCNPAVIVERNDIASRRFEGLPERAGVLFGDAPEQMRARIGQAEFAVSPLDPHKTGAYLDQQVNWEQVAARVKPGMRVLDVCCHLGGFGIHAALAGAEQVIAIDSAADAIAGAKQAAEWAGVANRIDAREGNLFDLLPALEKAGEQFDVIVLDPPSFTRTRDAVPGALRGYKEMHIRALKMLKPGGVLATYTCSFHIDAQSFLDVVVDAAADTKRALRLDARQGASPDHPVLPAMPESEYLKGFVLTALG
jgi:23S rRNA (cytosine1962-C5)-methyltransferase